MASSEFTPAELGRQLDRIERRIERVEARLEERYVPMAAYNVALKTLDEKIHRVDEKIDKQTEAAANTRRMVIMLAVGFVSQVLLLLIAAVVR